MKENFYILAALVGIGLAGVTVWLMLDERKHKAGPCACNKKPASDEGIRPPSCGIGWTPGKKNIGGAR